MTILVGIDNPTQVRAVGPFGAGLYAVATQLYTSLSSGTATGMQFSSSYNLSSYILCFYDATGTTLLGQTGTIAAGTGLKSGSLLSSVGIIASTNYVLAIVASTANNTVPFYTDSNASYFFNSESTGSFAPPATVPTGNGGLAPGNISVAITGTTGGGGTGPAPMYYQRKVIQTDTIIYY